MSFATKFIRIARNILPMPFTIAVILTLVTFALVFIIDPAPPNPKANYEISIGNATVEVTPERYNEIKEELNIPPPPPAAEPAPQVIQVFGYWEKGFWELLQFAMQMVLILVLGHALALSQPVNFLINKIVYYCSSTASAAAIISFSTITVGYLNWGLGLIFGAVLARKAAEYASEKKIAINYPLIAAAGYACMMVWHGGFSGSAPLKVAEQGHFLQGEIGIISVAETLFSTMNITVAAAVLLLIPLLLYFAGKRASAEVPKFRSDTSAEISEKEKASGAEKLDHSKILGYLFAAMILGFGIYQAIQDEGTVPFSFLSLNYVNFMLFGLGLFLHGSFSNYIRAIDRAVGGASGIIIQFPIYAGIMGLMKYSGLINVFADFFIDISSADTLPVFTFISAGIVNIFVPSGGGQWAVQGPIIVEAAKNIGASIPENIMALAYGDQITNMIQPFWALPLLGITGLDAKDILPYTLLMMVAGIIIFVAGLMIF